MTIAESLLPEIDQELANTRKVLACVPEEKFGWKPNEKSMTLAQLASHVADTPSWGTVTMTTETFSPPADYQPHNPEKMAGLLEKFDKDSAAVRAEIGKASDSDFAVNWTMFWGGQKVMEMPRISVLRSFMLNHMIHHRGQLTVYLRLLDVDFPGVYGPSATDGDKAK